MTTCTRNGIRVLAVGAPTLLTLCAIAIKFENQFRIEYCLACAPQDTLFCWPFYPGGTKKRLIVRLSAMEAHLDQLHLCSSTMEDGEWELIGKASKTL